MAIPRLLARNGWTAWHLAGAAILVALGVYLRWDAWGSIVELVMRRPSAAHIPLVPLVFVWLVWVRRERLRFCQPVGTWIGPLLIGVGWLMGNWGYAAGRFVPSHVGALLIALGFFLSVVGTDVLRHFLPAFGSLLFLIPVPVSIVRPLLEPMQWATADVTQAVYGLFGMDIVLRGESALIAGHEVLVADAFGVLGVLFAFITMGYAIAFAAPLKWNARVLILALSPLLGFLANICRVLATAWLYAVSPERVEQIMWGTGWVMLGVAFFAVLGLFRMLDWASVPVRRYTLAYGS